MLRFGFKKIFLVINKNKKSDNSISNIIKYSTLFHHIDFPFLISCRQLVKKDLRNLYGQFYIGPFFVGQGLTVANALRRTLLSDLSSLAITSVSIENIVHQYQSIQGLQESVFDFLINLKDIVFYSNTVLNVPQIGYLQIQGPCIIKAKDLFLPSCIQCVDHEQYIATLAEDGFLNIKFVIRQGKSSIHHNISGLKTYSLKNKKTQKTTVFDNSSQIGKNSMSLLNNSSQNLIIDASFNPILKVNYMIESLDFDKFSFEKQNNILESNDLSFYQQNKNNLINKEIVILELWTNGSISPVQALKKSIQKLIRIFFKLQKSKLVNRDNYHSYYIHLFEILNNQYNSLKTKHCQTLSFIELNRGGMQYGSFADTMMVIEQLNSLINQLE